jgi:O-antigen/teichoic acid export membrane protein
VVRPLTPEPADNPRDLRGRVLRGVGWMMASQSSTQVIALLTSIIIARLLSRHDVGVANEAVVFATLALVIADFGVAAVIVQRPTLTEADTSTAFWVGMALGVVLTLAGFGLSWPIAALYGQHEVQPLFAVLSLNFLFTAPGIVPGALLTRELDFRTLEVRTIIASFTSCGVTVVLAVLGFGPWAIIAQSVVIAFVSTALLWRATPWRPRAAISMQSLREMRQFAGHTFGARSLQWAQLNVDNLLIGRFLGAAPLGAYSIAASVSLTPLNRIALPITQVFFPAFSRMEDPDEIAAVWIRALRVVALIVVPVMLGLVVIGQEFVLALFGRRWLTAVTPLELMAPIGLLQALTALSSGVLQSIGNTRLLWRSTAVISGLSVAAFAAGLPWGIRGVAVAYLVASVVMQPALMFFTARALGVSAGAVWRSLSGVIQAAVGMMAVVFGARAGLLGLGLPVGIRLPVLVLVGILAYTPLIAWREPEILAELRDARRRSRGGGDPPDAAARAAELITPPEPLDARA